jgi:hypothetical protein
MWPSTGCRGRITSSSPSTPRHPGVPSPTGCGALSDRDDGGDPALVREPGGDRRRLSHHAELRQQARADGDSLRRAAHLCRPSVEFGLRFETQEEDEEEDDQDIEVDGRDPSGAMPRSSRWTSSASTHGRERPRAVSPQAAANPRQVSAIAPSSRYAGRAMTLGLARDRPGGRIRPRHRAASPRRCLPAACRPNLTLFELDANSSPPAPEVSRRDGASGWARNRRAAA